MTPADELTAAADTLEPLAGHLPPAAALELSRWLRAEAHRLTRNTLPEWQDTVSPHAVAFARAINGGAQQ
ncbi:hypothetical protein [Streptomyces sp. enrichment culture]|uniref:hypothetical protein n=1 Tax=Streptomyces sp. enrichment culture TaxID=1795815 RepID=UPI003F547AC2